ncbi:MAG: sulfatase-like hydrolase/transferase [Verrucomicrobiota bacterium]
MTPRLLPFLGLLLGPCVLEAQIVLDFASSGNVRPELNPYPITVSGLNGTPPTVSTSDPSGNTPGLSGSFQQGEASDGSFVLTLDGRSNSQNDWVGQTWTGGTPELVRGNNTGLGVSDGNGNASVDGGEAILWTFDLSSFTVPTGKSLVLTGLTFSNANAEFWQLTGTPGASGAGTLVATANSWTGSLPITEQSAFALAGTGRLQTMTLALTEASVTAPPSGLVASGSETGVLLDWDDLSSPELDFYTIYRSTSSPVTTSDQLLGTATSSQFEDTTAPTGQTSFYRVSATHSSGAESGLSNEVSFTPRVPTLQTLDASVAASVLGQPVTSWLDQSGNNNSASPGVGSVTYPGPTQTASGLPGLAFGPNRSSLQLLDTSASQTWLDHSTATGGFSLLLAFKVDSLLPGQFNDVFGNSTDGSTGLQIGYTPVGQLQIRLANQILASSASNLQGTETIVLGLNYDAAQATYQIWESLSSQTVSGSAPAADFSTAQPVSLGSLDQETQFFHGLIGEVRLYDRALASSLFQAEREELVSKWLSPPNIIMFLTDDMAWYDTPVRMDERMENSAQEIMRRLQDPNQPGQPYYWNMQKLADEGMLLRNAYSSAPQCTPTRANLQTGQTTARNRIGLFLSGSVRGLEFDERNRYGNFPLTPNGIALPFSDTVTTIPEALSAFGYRSAHYGKWHLASDPAVEGYLESDGDTDNNEGETYDSNDTQIPDDISNPKRMTEMTDKAIAFMNAQQEAGHPFYIQLSHYAVHNPWECFPSSRALFQNDPDVVAYNRDRTDVTQLSRKRDPAAFFGMLYDMDQTLGRLMDELESLGITEKTYIVFKSDNGYRRFNTQNFSQPFHGDKWFLWQGGLRVPMMIKGPGVLPGGVSTVNVTTYDLLPTFYDWAGGDPESLSEIDGLSLKALLEGETPPESLLDRSLYFHSPHYRNSNPFSAIIKGRYKLIHSYDATIRTDISVDNPNMLFDLSTDPGEVANINTSPGDNAIAAALWAELDAYLESVDAWRPRDNAAAYTADAANQFESDGQFNNRSRYAPFEGNRGTVASPVDAWFASWGVDLGADSQDFDLDGRSNLMEYALGTNPLLPDARNSLTPSSLAGPSPSYGFAQRYDSGGVTYRVFSSSNLSDWTPLGEDALQLSRSGGDFDWLEARFPSQDQRFLRLEVSR